MTDYTAFCSMTGLVLVTMQMPSAEDAQLNTPEGAILLPGYYPPGQYRLALGEPVPLPPKPGDWAVWDSESEAWTDPRDPAEELAAARAAASMSRSDFLLAAIGAGIIQTSDAGPAARGEIPPSLIPVFERLAPEVQIEAVVRWGAATMIERANPVLLALADEMGLTALQLDALFGLSFPPEHHRSADHGEL